MFKFPSVVPKLWLRLDHVTYGRHLKLVGWPAVFRYPHARLTLGENVTITKTSKRHSHMTISEKFLVKNQANSLD